MGLIYGGLFGSGLEKPQQYTEFRSCVVKLMLKQVLSKHRPPSYKGSNYRTVIIMLYQADVVC